MHLRAEQVARMRADNVGRRCWRRAQIDLSRPCGLAVDDVNFAAAVARAVETGAEIVMAAFLISNRYIGAGIAEDRAADDDIADAVIVDVADLQRRAPV